MRTAPLIRTLCSHIIICMYCTCKCLKPLLFSQDTFRVLSYTLGAVVVGGTSYYLLRKYVAVGVCRSRASLKGRTVIVTGANAGVGLETAADLAGRGARVIMASSSLPLQPSPPFPRCDFNYPRGCMLSYHNREVLPIVHNTCACMYLQLYTS